MAKVNGGRVFNGVDLVRIEIVKLGWRIGWPTMVLAVIFAVIFLGVTTLSTLLGIITAVVGLICLVAITVLVNTADTNKVLSEITVIRLILMSLWGRTTSNY